MNQLFDVESRPFSNGDEEERRPTKVGWGVSYVAPREQRPRAVFCSYTYIHAHWGMAGRGV